MRSGIHFSGQERFEPWPAPERSPWSPAGLPLGAPSLTSLDALSPREREIADMVARGLSNKAVAIHLGISHWTVSTHLRRIFAKLDINGRIELCRLVITCTRL
ncbi:regulatory protein, luxR family [Sphingomonas sp. OV641]|jgi:DNA-binding CsgD family transcriptional regulator|uniref:helix-turn-helix domain-containing protein n=1 Tax=unclassified Sphingomonas TaxID=196159 RepID=UPI0008C23545|nr:helix-turn-helix transcriptional regulator [Sphingomonas sp. CCH5-D11]SEI72703.1 regulatory protein, luxR family [Sphingomonas sp. OV641]